MTIAENNQKKWNFLGWEMFVKGFRWIYVINYFTYNEALRPRGTKFTSKEVARKIRAKIFGGEEPLSLLTITWTHLESSYSGLDSIDFQGFS